MFQMLRWHGVNPRLINCPAPPMTAVRYGNADTIIWGSVQESPGALVPVQPWRIKKAVEDWAARLREQLKPNEFLVVGLWTHRTPDFFVQLGQDGTTPGNTLTRGNVIRNRTLLRWLCLELRSPNVVVLADSCFFGTIVCRLKGNYTRANVIPSSGGSKLSVSTTVLWSAAEFESISNTRGNGSLWTTALMEY
jgi:hypothetical protein